MVIYLGLIVTMLFWGGTFIAGRIVSKSIPPPDAAFMRFLLAAAALALLTRLIDGHLRPPPRKQLVGLLLLGFTGVFCYNICFFTGLKYIEAGRAALIIALNPLAITIGAVLLFGERLSPRQCSGLLISLAGALLVITNGDLTQIFAGGFGWGETAIIGCVISWAGYSLIGRSVLKSMTPLSAVFYSALFGSLMLFPATLVDGTMPSPGSYAAVDWISLFFLGFLGTAAGFSLYYRAITKIGAARSSVFINLVPLFSIVLAWICLAETVNISVLTGGIILMSGVYLTNKKPKTQAATAPGNR